METIDPEQLIEKNPLFESLFAPLYFKAAETRHEEPIIMDPEAVKIMAALDYDFSYFDKNTSGRFLVSVRTKILGEQVSRFIDSADNPVIINLGAGLDTRYARLMSPKIRCWYDIDLPEVIDLRKKFSPDSENHKSIGKSALDYSWIIDIDRNESYDYLFIAEGLLMYFVESDIGEILKQISENFPSSLMLCEVFHDSLVNYNVKNKEDNREIIFRWGIAKSKELELLCSNISIEDEWNMFDYHKNRQKIFVRLLALILPKIRNSVKIVRLRFASGQTKKERSQVNISLECCHETLDFFYF